MARDKVIETVVRNWAPRFISNGVPLFDYQEVTDGLEAWDDWCPAWSARAAEHEAAGRAALAEDYSLSAGQHLQTAAVIYHFAKFVFVHDMDQLRATHEKAVACHTLALPHLQPVGERVTIQFEGSHLYGILRKPPGATRPPVVIMCMGLDSAKEEMATNEAHFLARGLATLAFDGPGQGEAEYNLAMRPDYEAAVAAVADFVETRSDLDSDRIGLWGVSFGGYYAPRAAAFETRIKACIAISGPFDFGMLWGDRLGHSQAVFRVRSHSATLEEAEVAASTFSLVGVGEKITCPLFIVGGENDPITPPDHQRQLAEAASGPTELLMIERGNHCVNNQRHRYSPQTADWMAGHLSA